MSRFARHGRVFFIEEPILGDGPARYETRLRDHGVHVATPVLPHGTPAAEIDVTLRRLVDDLLHREHVASFVAWYYTPMMLTWTDHLRPRAVIYDCMDELSLFRGAPAEMIERERELLRRAQLVFTGGVSLYEAKRERHPHVHCFPSSIDRHHFTPARTPQPDPEDQRMIPPVRLGFAGVIDERMDIALLEAIATRHPEWQLVMIGPVVKIDPATLPRRANIHFLGPKPYADLPSYMAGWDVALLPFALNESTRFISPTKTPEYLAAGRPVVSTPIRDVASPYGTAKLVSIAETPDDFCTAIERILAQPADVRKEWRTRVDGFLSTLSWDRTYENMVCLINEAAPDPRNASRYVERGIGVPPLSRLNDVSGATFNV
jgi:UDP-galactopyranose mutase